MNRFEFLQIKRQLAEGAVDPNRPMYAPVHPDNIEHCENEFVLPYDDNCEMVETPPVLL